MNFDPIEKIDTLIWGDAIEKHGVVGRAAATTLRYLYAVLRDFFSGQLTLRAMSLVYTTLLSIVPLLAFSFSVLKGFGVHEQLEAQLYGFLEPLGAKGDEITTGIMDIVDKVNVRALGGLALLFFIYTAVSMVQKIEESFNYVWYVSKPRSFARRFTEYVFVLLIGPVAMVSALSIMGTLQSETAVQWLLHNEIVGPVFESIGRLTPYAIVAGVFTFLYMFMPNTKVRLSSALVGGLAGGFMWATSSAIFAAFIVGSTRNQAIYASFAIPITALIWLYLNWLILMVGAQLAFYHQNPAYLRIGRRDPRLSNSMRERLALNIMYIVGTAFRDPNHSITFNELGDRLKIPSVTIAPVAVKLENAGLLILTESEQLQPGRDISRIRLEEILRVVRSQGETGSHHLPEWDAAIDSIGGSLDDAISTTIGDRTLAEVLDEAAAQEAPAASPIKPQKTA